MDNYTCDILYYVRTIGLIFYQKHTSIKLTHHTFLNQYGELMLTNHHIFEYKDQTVEQWPVMYVIVRRITRILAFCIRSIVVMATIASSYLLTAKNANC